MAIEKKLIHFGKLADFEAQLTAGNILDYSIVFIQDAKKIWTHGTYYDCSEGGASEETSNYYITEFTYYDYYNAASENGQLQISANDATGLIDSIERGSRILIPYGDSVSGYAIMLGENDNGEVYVAVYSTRDVITTLFFENDIRQGNNLTFDNDVTISNALVYEADTAPKPFTLAVRDQSGAIDANGIMDDQGNWWVTPTSSNESRASADYQFQSKIQDLEEIREGASKGATAVQPSALPTKVSQLENDRNFVDEQTLSKYVKKETFAGLDTAQASAISGGGMLYALPDQANGGEDDILLSRDSVKTINGESILGEGDITIEGGSLTESDIAAMGFTKNTGTYSKPSGGIPKSDLASAVQTSLGKADTALQSYTEQYKGTITGVSANGTSVATSGVANIPAASTSAYGVTKLSSATNSTSTTLAATASAVKAAYDLANSYKGTVTGVKVNGTTKSPTSGTVDIGNVVTSIKINGSTKTPSSGVVDLGTISGGGSSGGSGAYSEVNHGTSDTTFTLTPNTFHIWDEVANLTLTFGSETSGVANEFLFQFTSGSEPTTLTMSDDIKWTEELVIEANRIYQISILNGLASVLSWEDANTALIENHITYDAGNFMNGGTITFEYPTASELIFYMKYFSGGSLFVPQGSTQVSVPWDEPSAPIIQGITPTEDSIYKYILP